MIKHVARMKRAYAMGARAEAAERTERRIQDAAVELFRSRPFQEVTLQAVADASRVTLQTVLRRFGSKEKVFTSAAKAHADAIFKSREVEVSGDVATVVGTLVASYEDMGDLNWRGVSQEDQFAPVKKVFDEARARHRQWIETCFGEVIRGTRGDERKRRVLLLFTATDFYVWKLYRRDLGMSRALTTARIIDLVNALVHDFRRSR
jgi:AcrR family transcriptional regulator